MKNKRFTWLSLIVILVLLLSACARAADVEETAEPPVIEQPATAVPTATAEPTATEEPTAEPTDVPATEAPTAAPTEGLDDEDERMQALISSKIGGCHMLNFILRQTKTREQWSVTIDRMIGKGADVNAEEKEMIIDYLVSRQQ